MDSSRYYGQLVHHRTAGSFVVSESTFRGGLALPFHSHEFSYFTFTLSGSYRERYDTRWRVCTPGTVVAHPAFEAHSEQFTNDTALLLRVALAENEPEWAVRAALDRPACLKSAPIAWAVLQMHRELHHSDPSSDMIVEGLAYELVGHALRSSCIQGGSPRRALCAQAFIRSSLRHPISLAVVSREVGVSRATLYRDFKSTFGFSPGDYLRQVRLEAATELLGRTSRPISEIAAECGFYDQSHFDRTFRLALGASPSGYRNGHR